MTILVVVPFISKHSIKSSIEFPEQLIQLNYAYVNPLCIHRSRLTPFHIHLPLEQSAPLAMANNSTKCKKKESISFKEKQYALHLLGFM